jgi:hypothetical protein
MTATPEPGPGICPVCGGPTTQFWPSGNPEPCSGACELADAAPALYISEPGSDTFFNPRDN